MQHEMQHGFSLVSTVFTVLNSLFTAFFSIKWQDGFNESNALRWENIIQMGGGRFVRDILHEYLCR